MWSRENHRPATSHWQTLSHNVVHLALIVAISFIGGGNRSTRRKPPTCHKSLTNIMLYTWPWSWRLVLLVEETGVPGENHRPATSHWQTLSHNVVHLAVIVAISFIGGGNRSTRRKPPTCASHWQTLSHNVF